jgi:CDP-diglyceride synthetase
VGLIATLTTVACIIAADTGAYFVGKNLGRTKLTDISPKKTVEGALGGLASAVAVAVLFWKVFSWPGNAFAAAGYGVSRAVRQQRLRVCGTSTAGMHAGGAEVRAWVGVMLSVSASAAGDFVLLQVLTFISSLFGDLIESIMKRDAGLKVRMRGGWRCCVWSCVLTASGETLLRWSDLLLVCVLAACRTLAT